MRIRAQKSHLPLAWRACFALNGEEALEAVDEYLNGAVAVLEEVAGTSSSDDRLKRELGRLAIFLRVLQKVMSPEGGTRGRLILRKPRGRPGLSMADIQRRLLAVDMVNDLVAKGQKKDLSVVGVSEKMGISRSEGLSVR